MSLAKVFIAGAVTSPPVNKKVNKYETSVFNVAVNHKINSVSFFQIRSIGARAEYVKRNIKKGDIVFIEGDLLQLRRKRPDGKTDYQVVISPQKITRLTHQGSAAENNEQDPGNPESHPLDDFEPGDIPL